MGKNGGKNRNQKWSRKRKAEEKDAKSDKKRTNGQGNYNTTVNSNAKFEAYYSLVGLHNTRYNEENGQFVPCAGDEEKHKERDLFMTSLSGILPASFRVDRSLDPTIQKKLLEELQEFVGKEMEVEIELPRRSAPCGGVLNILENGSDGEKKTKVDDVKDDSKQDEAAAKPADDTNNASNGEETSNNDDGPIIVKKTIAPAKPIPFINSNGTVLGYQLAVDRRTLRRNKSLQPLHEWLKVQSDCGHITRQETVSMIPPVVLNVKEGMSVLDMCAAPGSKTCQLLEVAGGLANSSDSEPTGFVVANDADPKRAYMLVHQLRRMNSPAVFVTSCDGQYFPILDAKADKGTEKEGMFDRVLCDVPCSGDGTVRKNPGIWKQWNQLGSLALHPLQLSIALRGARLTHVGGYVVYSTCSMNPMENESVVAELLRITDGSLVLEDPRERMEGLIARPGWSTWKVLRESKARTRRAMKDRRKKNNPKMMEKKKEWEEKRLKDGEEAPPATEAKVDENQKDGEEKDELAPSPYDTKPYVPPATWDDAALSERTTSLGFVEYASYDDVEPDWCRRVRASCFPPTEEEAKRFELEKCMRCLPQDMDTGGFFVALLKKVKPLSKGATMRMDLLAKESRGGVEVNAFLNKTGDEGKEKKSANGKESDDVTMTESSAAEDKTDTEPAKASEDKDSKPKEEEKKEEEEPIQKAPTGKVGIRHKMQNKTDTSKNDFIPCDPSIWPPIVESYGLSSTFPKDQFMVRASGEAKILYFISKSVKKDLIDHGIQDRVTVINSGLKGFERCSLQDTTVSYRLAQEGIQYVVPHVTKRILTANMDDFFACVKEGYLKFDTFSESFQKVLEQLTSGSFIVILEGYEKDASKKMYLSMWKRTNCVNCFVAKIEMEAILSNMRALGFVAPKEEEKPLITGLEEVEKPAISGVIESS